MSHHSLDDLLSYDQGNRSMMLIGVVLLFLVILFIFLLHVIASKCLFNRIPVNDPNYTVNVPNTNTQHQHNGSARGKGLHPYVIASSIPVFVYHAKKDKKSSECAICLSVLGEGEICRRLPSCGHVFHVECIDMWLCSHFTCPICRSLVSLSQQKHGIRPVRKHDDVSIVIAAVENGSEQHIGPHNSTSDHDFV